MKRAMVYIFVLFVLLSMDMTSCKKKKKLYDYKSHSEKDDERKVNISNWESYGLKSNQEIKVGVLKDILVSLTMFKRGECPFGEGNCKSENAMTILSRLIDNLVNNQNAQKNRDNLEHLRFGNSQARQRKGWRL